MRARILALGLSGAAAAFVALSAQAQSGPAADRRTDLTPAPVTPRPAVAAPAPAAPKPTIPAAPDLVKAAGGGPQQGRAASPVVPQTTPPVVVQTTPPPTPAVQLAPKPSIVAPPAPLASAGASPAVQKPVPTPPGAPAAGADRKDSHAKINPFTGKTQELEAKIIDYENAQLNSKILQEVSNQQKARVQILQSFKEEQNLRVGFGATPTPAPDMSGRPAPALVQKGPPRKGTGKKGAEPPPVAMAPPTPLPPQRPRVLGIMDSGGKRMAIVEYAGSTNTVSVGESVGGQRVDRITADRVTIGGVSMEPIRVIPRYAVVEQVAMTDTAGKPIPGPVPGMTLQPKPPSSGPTTPTTRFPAGIPPELLR